MIKILAFAGSARKHSYNRSLVKVAASGAREAGATVTLIDLAEYPMPIFCEDLEAESGLPENARAFKQLLIEHDGFLIASPEYNSAYSPLLKNAIDWASRKESDNESPLLAYRGKAAVIMATSPGSLGGLRGLVSLRMLLGNIGVLVLPEQQAVANAGSAFGEDGSLNDVQQSRLVSQLGSTLVSTLAKLK